MKKNTMIVILLFLITAFTAISANAATVTCSNMWVNSVAGVDFGNGAEVWLVNNSGDTCGNLANGEAAKFMLPSVNTNKMLATVLLAVSMQKTLWVAYDDSTEIGALIVVSLDNSQ